jgi:hypothetical protein
VQRTSCPASKAPILGDDGVLQPMPDGWALGPVENASFDATRMSRREHHALDDAKAHVGVHMRPSVLARRRGTVEPPPPDVS